MYEILFMFEADSPLMIMIVQPPSREFEFVCFFKFNLLLFVQSSVLPWIIFSFSDALSPEGVWAHHLHKLTHNR